MAGRNLQDTCRRDAGRAAAHVPVWGPGRFVLYNDYAQVLGRKHPVLGRDFLVWHAARAELAPLVERVYHAEALHSGAKGDGFVKIFRAF